MALKHILSSCIVLFLLQITCKQIYNTVIALREQRRLRYLLSQESTSMKKALLLKKLKQKQAQKRKFWTRPGRTDAWWTSLKSRSMVPPEWKENFRMLKESFYILAEKLRPVH